MGVNNLARFHTMTALSMDQIQARMGRVPLFAIFMRPTDRYDVSTAEGQELMRQHLQFQLELEDRGILLAAGPLDLKTPARRRLLVDRSRLKLIRSSMRAGSTLWP
jgi:hypothetical protein